ncbi:MAG: M23 family metallopeptidase [Bacilli bacterium]|nr:M23 family metallopeptidase [Bacilli bacterium]
MTNRRLKKPVLYGMYISAVFLILGTIFLIEGTLSKDSFKEEEKDRPTYVSDTIFSEDIPVVGNETKIIRPYTDTEIKVVKNYYDYQGEVNTQINSILYHENTYLQNSGVSYGGKENFDVVAILDGTVSNVKEDALLGNIIEIEHSNEMISIYSSLSEVNVKKGDIIKQGVVLGKSGTNNIAKDLGSHLDLELIIKGQTVNPENYYDKSISEI